MHQRNPFTITGNANESFTGDNMVLIPVDDASVATLLATAYTQTIVGDEAVRLH
jgi:uncharacterized membrane protein YqgA involved in biofilm formation